MGINALTGSGDASNSVETDRLFVIGNGQFTMQRNALTILKNANTTIGGSLTINGNGTGTSISFPAGRGTDGQYLRTNSDGTTGWASPESAS